MESSQAMNMSLDSHDLEVFGIFRDIKVEDQSEHVRKRRKTDESPGSIYWNDYTKVWVEEGDPPIMKLEGMCKHCCTFISVDSSGCGANGLKRHTASCLKRKVALQAGRGQTVKGNTSLAKWKFDQMAIRPALCEMVILQELPFTFVECKRFSRFVQLACPQFHIPERLDVRNDCVRLFHKHKQGLSKFFREEGMGRVSITSHCWTALDDTNFVCVSAHCIGKDWKLHRKVIGFCKVESHNASAIGDSIVTSLKEWGLTNLFSCTVDNAPGNEEAIRHVKYHVETLNKDILDGKYFHMRCATQIIRLVAQDSLEEIGISVRRVREAIKWLKSSPHKDKGTQWDNILNLFTDTIDCKKSLCLDVPTRWDSTYLMLESALPYEEAFKLFGNQHSCFVEDLKQRKHNGLFIGAPEKEDWANVKNVMEYLRKFYALTHVFSATRYPTSHLFFAEMCDLFDLIATLEMGDDSGVSAMARKMRSRIGKYWSEETELNPNLNRIVYIAAVLDPRQKMRHVETCFKTMFGDERGADMVKEVTDSMNELFEFYRAQSVTPTLPRVVDTSTVVPRVHSNHRVSLRFMALQSSDEEETSDVNELTLYLKAKRHIVSMDEIDSFDILMWWSEHPYYHVLSKMARDILAIPVSSVASEYVFSTGGRVLTAYRSSLTCNMVEALICAGDWLKISTNMESKDKEDMSEEEQQTEFQRVLAAIGEIAQKRNA